MILSMYFSTSQKITLHFYLPPDCLLTDFHVLKKKIKINFVFNYLPPDPVLLTIGS